MYALLVLTNKLLDLLSFPDTLTILVPDEHKNELVPSAILKPNDGLNCTLESIYVSMCIDGIPFPRKIGDCNSSSTCC